MKKIIFPLLFMVLISCSKSDDVDNKPIESVKDCVSKNYGVLTVNFGTTIENHVISVSDITNNFLRRKIVNVGIASDTIQLKPCNYNIKTFTSDASDTQISVSNNFNNRQVTQCSAEVISTPN